MANTNKKIECLYSWAEFYGKNNQFASYEKAQKQIEEFENTKIEKLKDKFNGKKSK